MVSSLLVVVLVALALVQAVAAAGEYYQGLPKRYQFSEFAKGTLNKIFGIYLLWDINNAGTVVGTNVTNGVFVISRPYTVSNFKMLPVNAAGRIKNAGITNKNVVFGSIFKGGGVSQGFVSYMNGSVRYFQAPGSTEHALYLNGMNDFGIAVGYHSSGDGRIFPIALDTTTGMLKPFLPNLTGLVIPTDITNAGHICGYKGDPIRSSTSFFFNGESTVEFSYAGASATSVWGMNNYDLFIGYANAPGAFAGKIFGKTVHFLNVSSSVGVEGLNDAGVLVAYESTQSQTTPVIGTPIYNR